MMDYDDWLFDSIKTYKNLCMYDLQYGVTAVDLVDGKSLCVATSTNQKHEVCELTLPDKLLQDSKKGKLKKGYDFRVDAGGFSPGLVTDIKHLPGTRLCAISQKGGNIGLWELGNDETDLMKERQPIAKNLSSDYPIRMSVSEGKDERKLAIGSTMSNTRIVDTVSFEEAICNLGESEIPQLISSLQFVSENQLVSCTVSGDIVTMDARSKNSQQKYTNCGRPAPYWTMSNCFSLSNTLLQMSSEGEVILLDNRNLNQGVVNSNMEVTIPQNFDMLCVQQSPDCKRFSVSGFDGCVHIFDTKSIESQKKALEPVFVHEGHVINSSSQSDCMIVSKHLWHPWVTGLVISCGDEGSIHAWQWNEN